MVNEMQDYLTLGPTPAAENCVQVGVSHYDVLSRLECKTFIEQLERKFPITLPTNSFKMMSNPHDFGSY